MKKILWLAILIALSFVLIGCPTDDKKYNGPIRARFEFKNEKFDARNINPSTVVMSRSARTYSGLDDIDVDTFAELNDFYASLGALKEAYTPTQFQVYIDNFNMYNFENIYELTVDKTIDFGTPVVFELLDYNIEPGTYNGLWFDPHYSRSEYKDPIVTFTVSGGVGEGHYFENIKYINIIDNIYTMPPTYIFPDWILETIYRQPRVHCGDQYLFSTANKLVLITNKLNDFEGEESYDENNNPVGNLLWGREELGGMPLLQPSLRDDNQSTLIAPFSGITIPEGARAVKFTLYWDLNNIIERYEGDTTATSDDIYIIANKFWERLTLTAEIEYHELED